jgi:hypothetical protein
VKKRELITLLGGAVATWPLAVRAQQTAAIRRVVVFMSTGEDDPQDATRLAAFERACDAMRTLLRPALKDAVER